MFNDARYTYISFIDAFTGEAYGVGMGMCRQSF